MSRPADLEANARLFAEWLGMKRQPARLLAIMWEHRGRAVSHETVIDRLGMTMPSLRSAMVRLREAMPEGSYLSLYGHGYRLTEIGERECLDAFADRASRRAAA